MFTGIIQEVGKVTSSKSSGGNIRFTISAPRSVREMKIGSSVAVNGACLTAVAKGPGTFAVEVVEETLKKTALEPQISRKFVNLELPVRADGRLDGHIVLGHVDTTGNVEKIEERDESWWFTVRVPHEFMRYVVHTGSIAVDGVSLTVAEIDGDVCRFSIIPHTMENTIFSRYRVSDRVNVEVDVLGKYIERMLNFNSPKGKEKERLTLSKLTELGY